MSQSLMNLKIKDLLNNIVKLMFPKDFKQKKKWIIIFLNIIYIRIRNLKFATYLKFATCENTNKINELW